MLSRLINIIILVLWLQCQASFTISDVTVPSEAQKALQFTYSYICFCSSAHVDIKSYAKLSTHTRNCASENTRLRKYILWLCRRDGEFRTRANCVIIIEIPRNNIIIYFWLHRTTFVMWLKYWPNVAESRFALRCRAILMGNMVNMYTTLYSFWSIRHETFRHSDIFREVEQNTMSLNFFVRKWTYS